MPAYGAELSGNQNHFLLPQSTSQEIPCEVTEVTRAGERTFGISTLVTYLYLPDLLELMLHMSFPFYKEIAAVNAQSYGLGAQTTLSS